MIDELFTNNCALKKKKKKRELKPSKQVTWCVMPRHLVQLYQGKLKPRSASILVQVTCKVYNVTPLFTTR